MRTYGLDNTSFDFTSSNETSAGALSVAELNRCIRGVIEAEDLFADVSVRGEISNLVKHSSGHVYLSLKDESALIRCVMWNGAARARSANLSDGMRVIVRGRVTVYEKQGQYQLVANDIVPDGVGSLYVAFEQLKARLSAEGLFDAGLKKPLPRFPRNVVIITSPTAAALRDMVTIATRRMPSINLLLVPAAMQGEYAEDSIVQALGIADRLPKIDVVVLGRGGGSIEDLWCFNSEKVVRAINKCGTPVISAIGHETDFTLSDFAADLRAPTPSAAMELLIPDGMELGTRVASLVDDMVLSMQSIIHHGSMAVDRLTSSPTLRYPDRLVQDRWQSLDILTGRIQSAFRSVTADNETTLAELSGKLNSLSPLAVLGRGYGILRNSTDGKVIRHISEAKPGQITETLVSDGKVISQVIETKEGLF